MQGNDVRKSRLRQRISQYRLLLQGEERRQYDDASLLRDSSRLLQGQDVDSLRSQNCCAAVNQSLDQYAGRFQRRLELFAEIPRAIEEDIPAGKRGNVDSTTPPHLRHAASQLRKLHESSSSRMALQNKHPAILFHTPRHSAADRKMVAHKSEHRLWTFIAV